MHFGEKLYKAILFNIFYIYVLIAVYKCKAFNSLYFKNNRQIYYFNSKILKHFLEND